METLNDIFPADTSFRRKEVRQKLYETFFRLGSLRSYKKGVIIFQSGDISDAVYVVKEGWVRLFKMTPEGKETIFHIVNPGEGFGFAEVIVGRPRIRNAMTITDNTILCVISRDKLLDLISKDIELCLGLVFLQSVNILKYQNMVADMANLSVRSRVVQLLLRFSLEYGKRIKDYIVIDLPFTHDEIAKMVGASRQTVTSILNDLRNSGFLWQERRKFKVRKMDLF